MHKVFYIVERLRLTLARLFASQSYHKQISLCLVPIPLPEYSHALHMCNKIPTLWQELCQVYLQVYLQVSFLITVLFSATFVLDNVVTSIDLLPLLLMWLCLGNIPIATMILSVLWHITLRYNAVERKNQDSKDKAPQQLQSAIMYKETNTCVQSILQPRMEFQLHIVTRVVKDVKKLLNQDVNIGQRSLRMIQMPFMLPLTIRVTLSKYHLQRGIT